MRTNVTLLAISTSFLLGCTPPMAAASADSRLEISHDGRLRSAVVVKPDGEAPSSGWPVVMMLHGGGGSADATLAGTGWNSLAVEAGFVAVFPDGLPRDPARPARFAGNPRTWNSGAGSGLASNVSLGSRIDDVGFLAALLDELERRFQIDASRIYVAGHSNGAGMAYRFAAEHSQRVAAVGVMAGHLYADLPASFAAPVSLMTITGDRDPLAPPDGGPVKLGRAEVVTRPMIDHPTRWATANGLNGPPRLVRDDSAVTEWVWDRSVDASANLLGGKVTESPREGLSSGNYALSSNQDDLSVGIDVEVRFLVLKGHGHSWPGGRSQLPERVVGPNASDIDASRVLWTFFSKHARE